MKTNLLKFKRALNVTLLILLMNVAGITQGFAQGNVPTGAINGRFSVSENHQVYFAKGNLQYNAMAHSWRFAENQYDYIGAANNNISSEYNGWIDLFGWGTSGYHDANDPYNVNYQPWSTSISEVNSSYNYYGYGPSTNMSDPNLTGTSANYDWGVYNPIINGGNTANQWRTLTQPEWEYVFSTRTTTSGILYAKANVNNVNGIILLPDDWNSSTYSLSNTNTPEASFSSNTLTVSQWSTLEQAGAVFLPAAGYRYDGTSIDQVGSYGLYWTASGHTCLEALRLAFFDLNHGTYGYYYRCNGLSVRLVSMNAVYTSYNINATPNPSDGGTIIGAGTYQAGETCTLTATANEGYTFINWTENNEVVSTNAEYTFTVESARTLVANFEIGNITFADANVKAICVANWDTNGDGELSYAEAAAVTDLGEVFNNNSTITSFDELQYFTGVTSMPSFAFSWCSSLSSVVIPENVTSIEYNAFIGCLALTSVEIPVNVTSLGVNPWANCPSLEQITVEEGNPNYDSREGCHAIIETSTNTLITGCKNTVIPNTVTAIAQKAFYFCNDLESIEIPNSVTFIGMDAFTHCVNVTSITIPASVVEIEGTPFPYCTGVESIIVDEGNPVFDSREGCNAIINKNTNALVSGCKNTVIPNGVESIGGLAFYDISGLTSINIPNTVIYIGVSAFYGTAITSVEIPNSVTFIGSNAFGACFSLTSVTLPNQITTIASNTFDHCNNLESITIPASVTTIGTYAFANCTGLTSITCYVDNVPILEDNAFYNLNKNIPVYVPCGTIDTYQAAEGWSEFTNYQNDGGCPIVFADANVKALCVANWDTNGDGELSYEEAAAVTDLGEVFTSNYYINTFDELQYFTGLTAISENAFAWCQGLTSVVLPSTVTEIGFQAFYDCGILSITIPAAVTNIRYSALNCEYLETIVVEEGNTIYDSRDNCNAVIITSSNELLRGCKNTVIPNTVESMGLNAFSSSNIESVTIPASISYIDNTSFYACENLSEITVSTDNTVYDSRNNCNAIIETSSNKLVAGSKTTIIPSTVTAIDNNAFSYRFRWGAYNITIPESVVSIGNNAYLGGYGIESITVLAEVPPTLGNDAFYNVPNDIPVNVPCGTRNAYQAADGWSEFININVNPECGRQITVTVNPANTGTVTGAGTYELGETCTLAATPNSGYTFVNWTENNEVVSTNATYQFTVNANRDLVANFEEYVVTNHYVCNISQFADYMSVVAVVVIDGVEQVSETLEIGAFCGIECRGGKFATYFPPTQRYIYQIPVYGEGGDEITFKLYNHDLQQELDLTCTVELQWNKDGYGRLATPYEITFISTVNISASVNPEIAGTVSGTGDYLPGTEVTLTATANTGYVFANWTEGGNVVSENAVYTFTVEAARSLVANFNAAQSYTLNSGWNWWSTYIEQNGADGLTMLEEGLGEHGEFIQSRTGTMVENFDGSFWWGDLNAVTNEDMFEVKTNAQVSVTMTGTVANPASHPITVAPGWNWIGYVDDAAHSVDNALSSLTPNEDDIIQSRNAFSSYFPGWGWYGDLENMTPGQGYMYKSRGTASQTLVYPTAARSTNTNAIDYHSDVNYNKYRDVMDVMAKVVINGNLPTSDRYELAAFVGGECRGRAKLQYVEPMDTYLAFLTINGNDDEQVTFELYDEDKAVNYAANEANVIVFKAKEVVGRFSNPYILYFGNLDMAENNTFTVYPNPVAKGDEITINFEEDIVEAELFVENELGLTVDVIKLSGTYAKVRLDLPSGMYVLRVVTEGDNYYNEVIVK